MHGIQALKFMKNRMDGERKDVIMDGSMHGTSCSSYPMKRGRILKHTIHSFSNFRRSLPFYDRTYRRSCASVGSHQYSLSTNRFFFEGIELDMVRSSFRLDTFLSTSFLHQAIGSGSISRSNPTPSSIENHSRCKRQTRSILCTCEVQRDPFCS